MSETESLRVDKWLWHARFYKTRTLAARQVAGGAVRVNGTRITKPATTLRIGDALTFPQGDRIRVVVVAALGTRRGPAPEAQALYEDRTPVEAPDTSAPVARKGGRPTKKDRRDMAAADPFSS